MYNAFLSLVYVISPEIGAATAAAALRAQVAACRAQFKDHEIIIVANGAAPQLDEIAKSLSAEDKRDISVIRLAAVEEDAQAYMAGLDRANGDYVMLLTDSTLHDASLPEKLYAETQKGFDVVCLRSKHRDIGCLKRILYGVFYRVLNKNAPIKLDANVRFDRIISRRALGFILRLREHTRFTKSLFAGAGFPTATIAYDAPYIESQQRTTDLLRQGFEVISTQTGMLTRMLEWAFMLSVVFLTGVVANALCVSFTGQDLLMKQQADVPGWTFLIVFISIMWMFLNVVLYLLSIFIERIYVEVRNRPLYITEHIHKL